MKTKSSLVLFAVLILTAFSVAQERAASALQGSVVDAMGLPGQGWTSIGNVSPIEHNNFYLRSYVEQGAAVFSTYSGSVTVTPFVGVGLVFDTKGYDWNNKVLPKVGFKVNKLFLHGVVSVGSAYSYEERFKGVNSSGLTIYVQDWFGWQPVSEKANRFPGSTWIEVGNLSPVEHGNILGLGYFSQGVVAKRFDRFTLVPYFEATVFRDSKGFDWDNRANVGGGVKAIFPHGDIYSEVGVAYLHENRFQSGLAAGGLSVFTNFSFNWNLLGRKAGR
ncbi:MAG TPA: hypothetical protein VN868_01635 [Terriglobales bacterium]|nr:hypothetical protein [Terriglobales bacterium]